jgi:NADPH-dependent curcumin reductase CurA
VGRFDRDLFRMEEAPLPRPGDGEALVRNVYLSVDPAVIGWVTDDTYMPVVPVGDVIRSGGIGQVVESRTAAYPEGSLVYGMVGWQEYCLAGPGSMMTVLPPHYSPLDMLSVYGITGMAAYFGLLDIGQPTPGETVVVSAAAGATGSIAGQIAKVLGCRVVGIAGSAEKCAWVVDKLGFDACLDYRAPDWTDQLAEACPDGVDVFFDNVGGPILDAVMERINLRARVVVSGVMALSDPSSPAEGAIRSYGNLIIKRARMEGFVALDYMERFHEAVLELTGWVKEGKIRSVVEVVPGLDAAPDALGRLFSGGNRGKLVVAVDPDAAGA